MVSNTSQKQTLLAIFLSTEKEIKLLKTIKGKVLQKLKRSVSHSSFMTELKKHRDWKKPSNFLTVVTMVITFFYYKLLHKEETRYATVTQ